MNKISKTILMLLIILACIGCDQLTKNIAQASLPPYYPILYLGGIFQFQLIENHGAMLGMGADLPPIIRTGLLVVFNGLLLVGLLWYLWKSPETDWLPFIAGALIIGGGVSNLYDRILNDGAVIDFMNLGIGWLRTGIFNVADVAIFAGAGSIILWGLMRNKAEKKENEIDQSLKMG